MLKTVTSLMAREFGNEEHHLVTGLFLNNIKQYIENLEAINESLLQTIEVMQEHDNKQK